MILLCHKSKDVDKLDVTAVQLIYDSVFAYAINRFSQEETKY